MSELQTTIHPDGCLEIYQSCGEGSGWLIYVNPGEGVFRVREFGMYGGGEWDHGPFETFIQALAITRQIESYT